MTVPAYVRPLLLLLALIVAPTVYVACARMPSAEEVQQDELARAQADYDSSILNLVEALKSSDPKVRANAASDLAWAMPRQYYDGRQSVRDTRAELALDALIPLLKDSNTEVRKGAASALASIKEKRAVEALKDYYPHEPDSDARDLFMAGLTFRGVHPSALPLLITALDDSSPDVRCHAAFGLLNFSNRLGEDALSRIDGDALVKKLLWRINVASDEDRNCYFAPLGAFPDQRDSTIPVLMRFIGSEDQIEVVRAVNALGRLGAKEAVPELAKSLKRKPPIAHDQIAFALGRIGDRRAVEPLLKIAKEGWLMNTLWALGNLRDPRAYPFLSKFLEEALDSDIDRSRHGYHAIEIDAAHALGRLGDPRAIPLLMRAMEIDDIDMQVNAARGLAELGAVEAIPLVEKLSRKTVWTVYTRDATGWKQPRTPFRKLMDEILEKLYAAQRARKEAA